MLRDLVVLRIAPDADELVEGSDEEIAELKALAERTDDARLRRMFRALLKEQEDLAWAPQPFAVLEMAVVRLAAMPAGDDVDELLARLDALERGMRGGGGGGGSNAAATKSRESDAKPRKRGASNPPAVKSRASQVLQPSDGVETHTEPGEGGIEAHPAVVIDRLRAFIRTDHPGLYAALEGARLEAAGDQHYALSVPETFAAQRLRDRIEALESVCAEFFGHPARLEIRSDQGEPAADDAAHADREAHSGEAMRQLRQRALHHPAISRAVEILDAEITEIRPTDPAR